MKVPWRRLFVPGRILSPQGLLSRAAAVVVVFVILHACGLREYTTLMTGTAPTGAGIDTMSMALALAYVAFHMATVVVAPVMVLAAVLWTGVCLWRGAEGRHTAAESPDESGQETVGQ